VYSTLLSNKLGCFYDITDFRVRRKYHSAELKVCQDRYEKYAEENIENKEHF
jgi:hypothetical protein